MNLKPSVSKYLVNSRAISEFVNQIANICSVGPTELLHQTIDPPSIYEVEDEFKKFTCVWKDETFQLVRKRFPNDVSNEILQLLANFSEEAVKKFFFTRYYEEIERKLEEKFYDCILGTFIQNVDKHIDLGGVAGNFRFNDFPISEITNGADAIFVGLNVICPATELDITLKIERKKVESLINEALHDLFKLITLEISYKDPIGDQLRDAEGYYVYFLAPFKDVDFNEA